jgi:membrane fusion protein, heavy metal efflux system
MMRFLKSCALLVTLAFIATITIAGPGHDHGHDAPANVTSPASPRFAASSDLFEVVGILKDKELLVFVDRFETNEPVTKATVELEVNGVKKMGTLKPDMGEFTFAADTFAKPDSYAIALTITAGDDIDILAGNLVVPEVINDHAHTIWTLKNGGIAAAGLVLLFIIVMLIKKSLTRRRTWGTNHV